ncbi:MAG TPA: 30S ribosomal protein S20 [Rhodothermales bacterium]
MPQHKSAEKRVRQTERRRERNRYHLSRMRTMVKRLSSVTDPEEAQKLLNDTKSYLDKLAGKGILKAGKVANTKSRLERRVKSL